MESYRNSAVVIFYKLSLLILFVSSMYPWFFWGIWSMYFSLLGIISAFLILVLRRDLIDVEGKKLYMSFFLFLVLFWQGLHCTLGGFVEWCCVFYTLHVIIMFKTSFKAELLCFITKFFGFFIFFSLIAYLLWLVNINLPCGVSFEGSEYEGYNYYLFCIARYLVFPRFSSVFAEPGHLTMGIIPLLCVNKFNLNNKYVIIFLVAELFTLSLAGYVCIAFVALYYSLYLKKIRKWLFVSIVILITSVGWIDKNISSDNLFKTLIIERVQSYYQDDHSEEMGDRFKDNTIEAYNRLKKSPLILWGLGLTEEGFNAQNGSSGYIVYILFYGVLGLVLLALFYVGYFCIYKSLAGKVTLFVYILLFIQNSYPFWYCYVFCFLIGLPLLKEYEKSTVVLPSKE